MSRPLTRRAYVRPTHVPWSADRNWFATNIGHAEAAGDDEGREILKCHAIVEGFYGFGVPRKPSASSRAAGTGVVAPRALAKTAAPSSSEARCQALRARIVELEAVAGNPSEDEMINRVVNPSKKETPVSTSDFRKTLQTMLDSAETDEAREAWEAALKDFDERNPTTAPKGSPRKDADASASDNSFITKAMGGDLSDRSGMKALQALQLRAIRGR